jgi:hypothetical protein
MLAPLSGLNEKSMFEQVCRSSLHTCAARIRLDDVLVIEATQGDVSTPPQSPFPPPEKEAQSKGGALWALRGNPGRLEP